MNKVEKYFDEFKKEHPVYRDASYYSAFHFHYEENVANELLELVLSGEKTATSSALPVYEVLNEEPPKVGDLSIVTDFASNPKCIIKTVKITVIPFKNMTFELCKKEGEDDSLESWRSNHTKFFTAESKSEGYIFNEDMEVIFEEFEVIYTGY